MFTAEGPMTDDRPWETAARYACNHERHITCGPAGPDRHTLAVFYRLDAQGWLVAGRVPPGSIVRSRFDLRHIFIGHDLG